MKNLLHEKGEILDKPLLNQEKAFNGVINFIHACALPKFESKTKKMKKIINWFVDPLVTGPSTILIIRLLAGGVFFWEGILKFVYVNQGVGRFTKLGFAFPETTAHFVGVC